MDSIPLREFLESRMKHMLERPRMYASSPQALEDLLTLMDEILRKYGEVPQALAESGYDEYLTAHGFGPANYCGRQLIDHPGLDAEQLWDGVVETWRDYLSRR